MPVSEIGLVTGLGEDRVRELITKLDDHGVIEWIGPRETSQAPSDEPPAGRRAKRPPVETLPPDRAAEPEAAEPEPAETTADTRGPGRKVPGEPFSYEELEAAGEALGPERRKAILRMFHTMDDLTLYEVLGIGPDVDKKEVRTAYFKLSKQFHPDTMYGKDLGAFKAKMEAVFQRLTEAYEVLGKKKRRAEYDAYIGLRLKALRAEKKLEEGKAKAREIAKEVEAGGPLSALQLPPAAPASQPAVPAASTAGARPSAAPSSRPSAAPEEAPPTRSSAPSRPSVRPSARPRARASAPPSSEAARDTKRRLMARKLAAAAGRRLPGQRSSLPPGGSQRPPRPSQAPRSGGPRGPVDKSQIVRGLATSLKMSAVHTGGVDMAHRYVAEAKREEKAGDLVAAENFLRLATALAPERQDVLAYHERIAKAVAIELADTYVAKAAYEEKNGKWAEAALSWGKVCDGRPNDAEAHWKAARGLFRAAGDLSRAKQYAQRAVDLDGASFDAKKTLGLIFHGAGMPESARRLLEEAKALDPRDEMVENLLRELK